LEGFGGSVSSVLMVSTFGSMIGLGLHFLERRRRFFVVLEAAARAAIISALVRRRARLPVLGMPLGI
jgi:hypothetical protein